MIDAKHLLRNMTRTASHARLLNMADVDVVRSMGQRIPDLADRYPQHMWADGEPEFEAIVAAVRRTLTNDIDMIYGARSNGHLAFGNDPFSGHPIVSAFYDPDDGRCDDWDDDFDPLECNPVGRCLAVGLGESHDRAPWPDHRSASGDGYTTITRTDEGIFTNWATGTTTATALNRTICLDTAIDGTEGRP